MPLEGLRLELGARSEIGDDTRMVKPGTPTPFEVRIDIFRIGPIVVAKELEANGNGRLPHKLGVIAGPVSETRAHIEQRMREPRLICSDPGIERWQRLAVEGQRHPV